MKTMVRILTALLLSIVLIAPQASAERRTSGNRGSHRSEAQASRPGNNKHHNGNARPSKNNGKHDKHRPENNRPNNYNKKHPGNHGFDRLSGNRHHGNSGFGRPTANKDNGNHYGHYKSPKHHHRPPMMKPPHRPHRPVPRPWHRPVRPHYWRPAPHAPLLSTMLGVAFGTALNLTINQLVNNGYNVSGYNSNTVYLVDVNQAGYLWPDATFYYNNGYLDRSEFFYTSPYPDTYRYSMLYNSFTNSYGMPVNVVNTPAAMSATWFAPDRGYITLQYGNGKLVSVPGRFVTTLTVGI